jgi:hypothetical protein
MGKYVGAAVVRMAASLSRTSPSVGTRLPPGNETGYRERQAHGVGTGTTDRIVFNLRIPTRTLREIGHDAGVPSASIAVEHLARRGLAEGGR